MRLMFDAFQSDENLLFSAITIINKKLALGFQKRAQFFPKSAPLSDFRQGAITNRVLQLSVPTP
jgi:hypothetical protein